MDLGLAGRAALVTGAGRGIGEAIARALAGEGCAVALVDHGAIADAERIAGELCAAGTSALAIDADVTSVAAAEAGIAQALSALGRLDILVCNAGITRDGVVWKMTEAAWDEVLDVNLKGCFTFCRAVVPVFRKQQGGRIVTIASINGHRGKFGQSNYAASKAGVMAFSRSLARELGAFGVTVNCVAPGFVRTNMTAQLPADVVERARTESPLNRIGDPEDVANMVAFLCSDRARYMTGQVVSVDGGQYM